VRQYGIDSPTPSRAREPLIWSRTRRLSPFQPLLLEVGDTDEHGDQPDEEAQEGKSTLKDSQNLATPVQSHGEGKGKDCPNGKGQENQTDNDRHTTSKSSILCRIQEKNRMSR
jgi:hypothetical protein